MRHPKSKEIIASSAEENPSYDESGSQNMQNPWKNKQKTKSFKKNHSLDRLNSESRNSHDSRTPTQYISNPNPASYYANGKDKNLYHSPNNSWFPPNPHLDLYKPNTYINPQYNIPTPYTNFTNFQTVVSPPLSNLQTLNSPQAIHPMNYPMFSPNYMPNMQKMGNNFNNYPMMSPPPGNYNFIGSPQYIKHTGFMMPPQQNNYNSPQYVMNSPQMPAFTQGQMNGFMGNQTPIIINNNVVSPTKKINGNANNNNYFTTQNKETATYVKIKDEIKKKDLSKSMSENNFETKKTTTNDEMAENLKSDNRENYINVKSTESLKEKDTIPNNYNRTSAKPPLKSSQNVNKTDRNEKNERISCKTNENFTISDDKSNQKTLAELFLEKKGKMVEKLKRKDSEKLKEKDITNNETALKRSKEDILKQRKELMSNFRKSNKRNSPTKSSEKNRNLRPMGVSENPFEKSNGNLKEDRKKTAVSMEKSNVLQRLAMGIKPKVGFFKFFYRNVEFLDLKKRNVRIDE